MDQIFDFDNLSSIEATLRKTWFEFREALAKEDFKPHEMKKAKKVTFLKVYDDLFHQHSGLSLQTKTLYNIRGMSIGRGAVLRSDEKPNFERFTPKKEYIREDNRFSPPGVEWLYLSLGEEASLFECTQKECRAKTGDRFGFCHFDILPQFEHYKVVDLTISDNISFHDLNDELEAYGRKKVKKGIDIAFKTGRIPEQSIDKQEFENVIRTWAVYTYSKLLSEQIFVPLDVPSNKKIEYAPFQTMAKYYISLGYSGIIYDSTVCNNGKNLVLFDKTIAKPYGIIEVNVVK